MAKYTSFTEEAFASGMQRCCESGLDVLSEIRHPNVLLLMATTFTDDHGLVSIFESIDCTLYHYMHDQGERNIHTRHCEMRRKTVRCFKTFSTCAGYVHSAINSHCVYLASNGVVKLGGWELAMHINNPRPKREYEERLRNEIFRWQAPELFHSLRTTIKRAIYTDWLIDLGNVYNACTMERT